VLCRIEPNYDNVTTLRIEVRDTGIGIPVESQAILFDRFVQGDGKETREHYGAGLGLSICRELAILMGGSIVFDSRPNAGSVFRVELPTATADSTRESAV